MIAAVLLDLDGTLYDRDALLAKVVEDQFQTFDGELEGVARAEFAETIIALDDHGYADKDALYGNAVAKWKLDPRLSGRLVASFWSLYDEYSVLPADTVTTLQALRHAGKKLGIITNGQTSRQQRKIDRFGLEGLVDVILISESEGVKKPDPEIFRRAVARCGVLAGNSVFVGDHPEADIAGAVGAGLRAVWKRVPYWEMTMKDVVAIDMLSELLPLLV